MNRIKKTVGLGIDFNHNQTIVAKRYITANSKCNQTVAKEYPGQCGVRMIRNEKLASKMQETVWGLPLNHNQTLVPKATGENYVNTSQ